MGKEIIWSFPGGISQGRMVASWKYYPEWGPDIQLPQIYPQWNPDILRLLGKYINTPRSELLNLEQDVYGLMPVLLAVDRRIGRDSLKALSLRFKEYEHIQSLIQTRLRPRSSVE